ncbi:MAG: hypothetical protein LC804_09670, partial [Acidobacteria bacterium]|nr:hypothetical protein [Acidobacteriota bacterium]
MNTVLVDRIILINAFNPGLNPFGDVNVASRFLAEAFARNTVPDASAIPGLRSAADDVDQRLQIPATRQVTVGMAHELRLGLTVSADFVSAHGFDQLTS